MVRHHRWEVLVHRKGLIALLVHANHVGQLEEPARLEARCRARLAHAHERAAATHPGAHGFHELRVGPHIAAGECGVDRAAVDDYVDIAIDAMREYVVEADEPHVHAHAGQGFQNAVVGVGLLVGQGVCHGERHPGAHLAPGIQNRHVELTFGGHPTGAVVDVAEFVGDMGHRVHELRELGGQGEVAAVAHAADRRAQDRAAGLAPVVEAFDARIVALVERVGEEVRQEAAFGVLDARNIGDHAGGGAVADGTDHGVQAEFVESVLVRFGADPLVAEEHHRLFAGGVGHVGELLDVFAHEAGEEVDPVALGFSGHAPCGVVGTAVHEVLRAQAVAILGFEIIQRTRAYGAGATKPVDDLFAALFIEQERELVEERGESHHIGLRAVLKPLLERVEHELAGGRMVDVERDLVFLVAPVVGQMVVHLDRVPDDVGQETHRVLMPCGNAAHMHGVLVRVKRPVRRINDLAGGAVYNLPILVRVGITIRLQLLSEEAFHQRNINRIRFGENAIGQQIHLWRLIHMQRNPLVMRASREIRIVNLLAQGKHSLIQMRAIGVTNGVCSPQFGKLLGLLRKILLARQGEAAGASHSLSFEDIDYFFG